MSASLVGSEMCIRDSLRKLHFISAYAPQSMADTAEKEDFYSDLLKLVWNLEASGPIVLAGDFNA
eukprot:12174417-Alexandrium_andersonii.AAC.1